MRLKIDNSILALGIGCAFLLALPACSDDGKGDPGNGNGNGNGDGGNADSGGEPMCNLDFARLEGADPVSFQNDVVPIFTNSCTQSPCHDGDKPKAGMFLGPEPDEAPATAEQIDTTHSDPMLGIVGVASFTAPAVQRVVPGDPANSFLVQKIADIQNDQGHMCDSPEGVGPCGDGMPNTGPALCLQSGNGQDRFDTIATWILQGAENN